MVESFYLSYSQCNEIYRRQVSPCEMVDATPGERIPWRTYYFFRRAMLGRLRFARKTPSVDDKFYFFSRKVFIFFFMI